MFELFSDERRQLPHRDIGPMFISSVVHLIALGGIIAVPLLYISTDYPAVPDMVAFVATTPAAPPPPPPPPPPAGGAKSVAVKPVPTSSRDAAPVETPTDIGPEPEVDVGVESGAPGGVEGGVLGGIVGGLLADIPPPPPPPPQVERSPVRTGGGGKAPAPVPGGRPAYPAPPQAPAVLGLGVLGA